MGKRQLIDLIKNFGPLLIAIALMFVVTRVQADYEDGVNAAFAGDFNTAFKEFTAAAEAGLDLAQYNLAILYFTGQGVDKNMDLAFKWTEAAALQGHLEAQANLASLYMEGAGTRRDIDSAIDWLTVAGRTGHANAAFALANMYLEGDPVERDLVQAHAWGHVARLNEHAEAADFIGKVERRLDPQQLSSARRLFARWQIEKAEMPQRSAP